MSKKSFAQQVREKYGDTVEQFAFRLAVSVATVKNWEKMKPTTTVHTAILEYANTYNLVMKPEVPGQFLNLSPSNQLEYLMKYFGCSIDALAARIHVDKSCVRRWKTKNAMSAVVQRYIYEVFIHPENFALFK